MHFQRERKATVLRVLVAALGLFLAANAGTLAARRSPVLMRAEMPLVSRPI